MYSFSTPFFPHHDNATREQLISSAVAACERSRTGRGDRIRPESHV